MLKDIYTYIQKNYDNGAGLVESMKEGTPKVYVELTDPADPDNRVEVAKWSVQFKKYNHNKDTLEENVKKAFALLLGQ